MIVRVPSKKVSSVQGACMLAVPPEGQQVCCKGTARSGQWHKSLTLGLLSRNSKSYTEKSSHQQTIWLLSRNSKSYTEKSSHKHSLALVTQF